MIARIITSLIFLFTMQLALGQEGYVVKKIEFTGNTNFSKSELLKQISINETDIIKRVLKKEQPSFYNEEFLKSDIGRLTHFYQREGFLYVEISIDTLNVNDNKKQLDLIFEITENTPILVGKIFTDTINKVIHIKPGQIFRDEDVNITLGKLVQDKIDKGYLYANGEYQIKLNQDSDKADIFFKISPNEIGYFGKTNIIGNNYVNEKIIRNQIEYKEGEVINQKKIDNTRKQINDLQLFKIASVSLQTNPENKNTFIPVNIRVEETPRLTGKAGIGYGTEDKFRAFAELTYKSLFGGSSRLNLSLKHSALDPYYISLKWIQPWFLYKNTSITVNPFLRKQSEPGFNTNSFGLSIPVKHLFSDRVIATIGYYISRVKQTGVESDQIIPFPELPDLIYDKSGVTGSANYSNLNPLINPEKGIQLQFGFKFNGYFFGSDYDFTRLWVDARRYTKIKKFVVSSRAMIGSVIDKSGFVPVEERFYSGGSTSNRGWSYSQLGPLRESGSPAGGKSLLELNLEIRHPIVWRLDGAVFMDVGNVWTKSFNYPLNGFAYSAGTGLRINTPIGPVRIDLSRPLWNEKKSWQFFINIGQAF